MSKYFVAIHAKAKDFIESLDKARKARVDRYCYLFEEYGTLLSSKYLKRLLKMFGNCVREIYDCF